MTMSTTTIDDSLMARAKALAGSEWESDLEAELSQTPPLDPPAAR